LRFLLAFKNWLRFAKSLPRDLFVFILRVVVGPPSLFSAPIVIIEEIWVRFAKYHRTIPSRALLICRARILNYKLFNYKLFIILLQSVCRRHVHRRLEWQTFAGIALAVHSGPSPAIV